MFDKFIIARFFNVSANRFEIPQCCVNCIIFRYFARIRKTIWNHSFGNSFIDFDTEAVVRLAWRGVKPLNLAAPVRYLTAEEGGVSHFQYGRDNVLLTWMHLRLMLEFALRLPVLLWRRVMRQPPFQR